MRRKTCFSHGWHFVLLLITGSLLAGCTQTTTSPELLPGSGIKGTRSRPELRVAHFRQARRRQQVEHFRSLDTDSDGVLTQAERQRAFSEEFSAFDTNADGRVLKGEAKRLSNHDWEELDGDRDGDIERTEYITQQEVQTLEELDHDQDASISLNEFLGG